MEKGSLEVIFEIKNSTFSLQNLAKINITTFDIIKPNRAILGTTNTFMATIEQGSEYQLPDNLIRMDNDGVSTNPPFLISETNVFQTNKKESLSSTKNRRILQNNQENTIFKFSDPLEHDPFSQGEAFIAVPYLPYISSCEYFGSLLFLPVILEAHPDCDIKKKGEIKPIKNLGFGQEAVSDICQNLRFNCKYVQNVTDTENTYWFNAKNSDTLFSFYEDPMSPEELLNYLNGKVSISSEYFIPMTVTSFSQNNKIPTEIKMTLGYYQKDVETRKLIKAEVNFSGFIDPKNYNTTDFNYTLVFNFVPMTHTELLIYFALPWFVYMIMYILVCLLTIFMTAIFMLYHKLVSRYKTAFFFFPYFKVFLPPSLYGLFYVVLPQFVYIIIIAVVFTHHIM